MLKLCGYSGTTRTQIIMRITVTFQRSAIAKGKAKEFNGHSHKVANLMAFKHWASKALFPWAALYYIAGVKGAESH